MLPCPDLIRRSLYLACSVLAALAISADSSKVKHSMLDFHERLTYPRSEEH